MVMKLIVKLIDEDIDDETDIGIYSKTMLISNSDLFRSNPTNYFYVEFAQIVRDLIRAWKGYNASSSNG